jgi:predicted HTH transcriptional regulator
MTRFVETKHVEYKRELTDGLEKEVVAFLNTTEGGQLWIGIDAAKDLAVGVPDAEHVQLQVKDRIRHNISPSAMGLFDVLTESVDGKTVVKVTVAGGPEKPYHLRKWGMSEKGCYLRVGSASKKVLDRLDLANRTFTRITSKERLERRLLDPTAVREAVINAMVHNDYTHEVPPKFELFSDRLEITSAGTLPQGFSREEFLSGYSVPRNKELMRVFKDIHLVEQLGSGVPRILQAYDASAFHFTENFLRIVLPFAEGYHPEATPEVAPEVTPEVLRLLGALEGEMPRLELQEKLGLKDPDHFREAYLNPALKARWIEWTLPESPRSPKQKYRLTEVGKNVRAGEDVA